MKYTIEGLIKYRDENREIKTSKITKVEPEFNGKLIGFECPELAKYHCYWDTMMSGKTRLLVANRKKDSEVWYEISSCIPLEIQWTHKIVT